MDENLKKRLVGAIVLVSLAVIFLPMLMDDEPVVSPSINGTNVPPRPVLVRPEGRDTSPDESSAAPVGEFRAPEPPSEIVPVPLPPPEVAGDGWRDASPVTRDGEEGAPASTQMPTPTPTVPLPSAEPAPQDARALSGWVVQVATFADNSNAESTLAKLRLAGFDSFTQEVRVKDKVMYRVRVGPEVDREKAEAARARIADELKLKGQVQRYP